MTKKRGHHAHPLIRYIDEQLKSGHSEEVIKKHLKNYGHDLKAIEQSLKIVKRERFSILTKIMIGLCVFVSLFLFLWTSLTTGVRMLNIIIGFSPTIICLTIATILVERPKHRNLNILWYLPILLTMLFLIAGYHGNVAILERMDINKLAALNFIVSFVFITVLYLTGSLRTEHIEVIPNKKKVHRKQRYKLPKIKGEKELKEVLQSVEDKCKALNFAIGRVYGNKKGGSDKLRSKIKINKIWYNEISDALRDGYDKKKDKTKILNNVNKIKDRLELLHKSEKEVFGNTHNQLKNLNRAEDGSDKILHVLIKNDKDPVKTYFDGGIEFCERIKKGL